ncbi:MAG TPA: polymer-forming cytoskeletal protein, partial [Hyphomicrobiaceae bacterium]|nr:polymer-forming cytoskeletal protein [Hyphomicrobiaceae bacterium]
MFNRKPDGPALPNSGPPQIPGTRPAQPRRATGVASVIGADLSITGNLESTGEVQIDGELQGDVHAARIVVGEQAMVTGALIA